MPDKPAVYTIMRVASFYFVREVSAKETANEEQNFNNFPFTNVLGAACSYA